MRPQEGNRRAHEAEGRLRELQESHEREMKEAVERGDRMRASMERVMKERLEKVRSWQGRVAESAGGGHLNRQGVD